MRCLVRFLSPWRLWPTAAATALMLSAATPAAAGDVLLRWDPNGEPNLAGYVVLYGTAPGVYTSSLEVSAASSQTTIVGLADGATYYFVVRAFNTIGAQSALSNEASVTLEAPVVPAPTIAGITPASASTSGGALVTITGTGFSSGATVRFGSTSAGVQSVTPTTIVAVAPARAAGTVSVSVTNPDGQGATATNAFLYVATPPTVTGVTPSTGSTAGGTVVSIAGTGFVSGVTVRFGSTAASVQSVTPTTIVAVAPARAAGTVSVSVTNPDGQSASAANAFLYVAPPPTITSVNPTSGSMSGGTPVTITGANFVSGMVVRFGSTAAAVTSLSASSVVVTMPALSPGAVPVSVTRPDGATATASGSFTVVAPTPVVSAVGPAWGPTAGGTAVNITGSQFVAGATVLFGATPATVTSLGSTLITVTTPPHAAGVVSVSVVNPGGALATKASAFTYQALAPTLTSISPSRGSVSGGNSVTLSGNHFSKGATATFDGVPGAITAVSATTMTVTTPARPAGAVTVEVRNPDGQTATLPGGYTYEALAPSIDAISPGRGPTSGGTPVTITGQHFGVGVFVTIRGVTATVTAVSATTLQVLVPAGSAGPAEIRVRNPDGLEARRADGFVYEDEEPVEPTPFVRYFAEGVQGAFFDTWFALANPHGEPASVTATFTDPLGRETPMHLVVPAGGHAMVDRRNMPALANEAFATRFESDREIGIDRTVQWDASGYGAHSETGIVAPRTTWYFAEGATHSGFEVFYLLQNPGATAAEVLVRYMLGTGASVEKVHYVAPFARTNVWVNQDDPRLRGAEVSAQLVSLNDVPIVAERSMYQSTGSQLFTAGHNSAGIAAPATRWFLAEGATGDFFDMFVLVANPGPVTAELDVTYLLAAGEPLTRRYTVAPNSRFTIWVDHEDPRLRRADVSVIVTSSNGVPVIVERTMWWPGQAGGPWTEAHNSAGATTTAHRWVLADGVSSDDTGAVTYALVANTGPQPTTVRFTLLTPNGRGASVEAQVAANSRFSVDVAQTFPEARNRHFGLLVESLDRAPLVVERATYWNAAGVTWAAGTNSLAMPLSATDKARP